MRTGFNLLLWTTFPQEEHLGHLKLIKQAGFDGIEIPLFEGTPEHFQKVGQAASDEGLGSTAVTVMPDAEHSAISPDASSREGGLNHLKWAIDCAAAAGSDLLCGPFHQPLGEFSGKGPTEDELERMAEVHRAAAAYAADVGLGLSVEPLNRFECYVLNTAEQASRHVARVDAPNFGFLYDTFHAHIEEKDPIAAIHAAGKAINHVHISENDRGTPGAGQVDFTATAKALKAIGYDGWLTVEAFGQAMPDLAAATRVWRPLFDTPEGVVNGAIKTIRDAWAAA